jgi:hypothetical protein
MLGPLEHVLGGAEPEAPAVQQAVADGDMDPEVRRPGQALHVAGLQGGQQQAEAGDGHGERIEIDAGDRVECLLCDVAPIASRLVVRPLLDQAMKSSEQEVPRPAGRIDQPHFAITELVDGRRQRPVENELLDELGRLQQRIALARGLAQILVQVAEEAGVPARVGEVADQCPGIGGNLLPELHHRHRGVAADPQAKDRVVGAVEEGMQAGQGAGLAETPEEIVAIVLVWVHAKVGVMAVARQGQSTGLRRAGDPRPIDQSVVLDEAQEDATQQPVHAGLGDGLLGPGFEGLGSAPGIPRRLPLGLQLGAQFRHIAGRAEGAFAQVVFEPLEQAGQVGKQDFGINHGGFGGRSRQRRLHLDGLGLQGRAVIRRFPPSPSQPPP